MLTGVVVYPFAAVLAALVGWRAARGGQPAFVVAMRVLCVLYLGWVVGATLFPLPVRAIVVQLEAADSGVTVNLVPFDSIRDVLVHGSPFAKAWILGGNVLTLAPFGFLLPYLLPRLATWPRMLIAALVFPLVIELSQLAVSLALGYSYRVTETDDVLLNVVGVLLGFAVFSLVRRHVARPLVDTRDATSPGAGDARRPRCAPAEGRAPEETGGVGVARPGNHSGHDGR